MSIRRAQTILAAASMAALPAQGSHAEAGEQSIPLTMQGAWAVVQVEIGSERHPYRFLVDTAAGSTGVDSAIDPSLFGTGTRKTRKVHGASGASAAFQFAKLGRIRVAGHEMRDLPVVVTDMARFGGDDKQHYDGILGNDVLRRFTYVFDLPTGRLTLSDARRPNPARWGYCVPNLLESRPMHPKGFVAVPIRLSSGAEALAIVDTGAASTVLDWAAASASGLVKGSSALAADRGVAGFDPKASTASAKGRVVGASLHGQALAPFDAKLSDLPVFDKFGDKDEPKIIAGIDMWRARPFAVGRNASIACFAPNR